TGPSVLPLELVRALSSTQLAWPGATGQHARPPAPRLADELTSLTARLGRRAPATLRARRDRCVAVSGPRKTGIHGAAVLAAPGPCGRRRSWPLAWAPASARWGH